MSSCITSARARHRELSSLGLSSQSSDPPAVLRGRSRSTTAGIEPASVKVGADVTDGGGALSCGHTVALTSTFVAHRVSAPSQPALTAAWRDERASRSHANPLAPLDEPPESSRRPPDHACSSRDSGSTARRGTDTRTSSMASARCLPIATLACRGEATAPCDPATRRESNAVSR
jgi:hypothetical protein